MSIRITVDSNLVVVDAHGAMDDVPYVTCNDVPPRMSALIGIRLGSGWREALRERLGPRQGCTHMVELIRPAITTLYQSMSYREPPDEGAAHAAKSNPEKPYFVDGRLSLARRGPSVAKYFPMFAKTGETLGSSRRRRRDRGRDVIEWLIRLGSGMTAVQTVAFRPSGCRRRPRAR